MEESDHDQLMTWFVYNKSQCEQGESILDRKTKEIVNFLKN